MPQADDVRPYPLGEPERAKKAEEPERWEVVDPANPYMQRSSKTGLWRNVRPPPRDTIPIWPLGGIP